MSKKSLLNTNVLKFSFIWNFIFHLLLTNMKDLMLYKILTHIYLLLKIDIRFRWYLLKGSWAGLGSTRDFSSNKIKLSSRFLRLTWIGLDTIEHRWFHLQISKEILRASSNALIDKMGDNVSIFLGFFYPFDYCKVPAH